MKKKSDILSGGGSAGSFEIELYNEQVDAKVKIALLEQSIGHINQTLIRIEKTMENGFASLEEKYRELILISTLGFYGFCLSVLRDLLA